MGADCTDASSAAGLMLLASLDLAQNTSQKTKKENEYGHDHSERRD